MAEQVYNPFEDKDVRLPVYKKNGKNLVLPAFISGVKLIDITSKQGEHLMLADLEFEIHESASKIKEIELFNETDEGKYNYRSPSGEVVSGDVFIGQRIKAGRNSKVWRNHTKVSGRMNRIFLDTLKALGVEIKTKKIEHEGKKIDAPVIPELTEDLLLGLPVFIWLDEESFTAKDGRNVSFTAVGKFVKIDGVERVETLENTLDENAPAASTAPKADDPFDGLDSDLPF